MMRKILFAAAAAAVVGLFAPTQANAQGPLRRAILGVASARAVATPVRSTVAYVRQNQPVRTAIRNAAPHYYQNVPMSIEEKATWLGRNQVVGHVGAFPHGLFEGTSTNHSTPEQARANTCKPINGGELVNSVVCQQPNGKYTAVNYYRPYASPAIIQASVNGPGTPVTIANTGAAHIAERAVWRPSYTATCSGPNCNR